MKVGKSSCRKMPCVVRDRVSSTASVRLYGAWLRSRASIEIRVTAAPLTL